MCVTFHSCLHVTRRKKSHRFAHRPPTSAGVYFDGAIYLDGRTDALPARGGRSTTCDRPQGREIEGAPAYAKMPKAEQMQLNTRIPKMIQLSLTPFLISL